MIVFDEATSALDIKSQDRVMESIQKLKSRAAIVLITHSHETLHYCDKICLMSDGKVQDYGYMRDVVRRHERFASVM